MKYWFKEIGETITNKLLEIKNTRLWEVYNRDIKIENWTSLPAVCVVPSSWSMAYFDSCNYESRIDYTVRLFDRIQDWIWDIEANIRQLADEVLNKLKEIWEIKRDTNPGYTYKVEYSWRWWYADIQEPVRVFEVELSFYCLNK